MSLLWCRCTRTAPGSLSQLFAALNFRPNKLNKSSKAHEPAMVSAEPSFEVPDTDMVSVETSIVIPEPDMLSIEIDPGIPEPGQGSMENSLRIHEHDKVSTETSSEVFEPDMVSSVASSGVHEHDKVWTENSLEVPEPDMASSETSFEVPEPGMVGEPSSGIHDHGNVCTEYTLGVPEPGTASTETSFEVPVAGMSSSEISTCLFEPSMLFVGELPEDVISVEVNEISELISDNVLDSNQSCYSEPLCSTPVIKSTKTWSCKYCEKHLASYKSLWRHINEIHLLKREFACENCSFVSKRGEHMESHDCEIYTNLNLDCKRCKMKFNTNSKLETHKAKNCKNKYFCTFCLKFFIKKKEFKSHVH